MPQSRVQEYITIAMFELLEKKTMHTLPCRIWWTGPGYAELLFIATTSPEMR